MSDFSDLSPQELQTRDKLVYALQKGIEEAERLGFIKPLGSLVLENRISNYSVDFQRKTVSRCSFGRLRQHGVTTARNLSGQRYLVRFDHSKWDDRTMPCGASARVGMQRTGAEMFSPSSFAFHEIDDAMLFQMQVDGRLIDRRQDATLDVIRFDELERESFVA